MARLLILLTAAGACAGCAGAPTGPYTGAPLSPLYNVTPNMMRPDGAMLNGLMPENPDDHM